MPAMFPFCNVCLFSYQINFLQEQESSSASPQHNAEELATLKEKVKRQEQLLTKCKETIKANKVISLTYSGICVPSYSSGGFQYKPCYQIFTGYRSNLILIVERLISFVLKYFVCRCNNLRIIRDKSHFSGATLLLDEKVQLRQHNCIYYRRSSWHCPMKEMH